MVKDKKLLFLRIYKILLSVSIVIAGVCLIAGCLNIYYSGNGYSRELVAYTFSKICIPIYICLGLVVGNFIIDAVIPINQKPKPSRHYNFILKNLLNIKDADSSTEYKKLEKRKTAIKIINIAVLVLSSIAFLIYALNSKNFHQIDINGSMIKAMWKLFDRGIVPFVFSIFTYYYSINLTKKQIEILKTLPKKETTAETSKEKPKAVLIIKIAILVIGVGILIFGAVTGGFADVLTKAVNICTECIGLG